MQETQVQCLGGEDSLEKGMATHFRIVDWRIPSTEERLTLSSLHICLCVFIINCGLVAKSCPTLCDSMDCSTPGFPFLHCLPEFTQTHVHWVGDAIQPSHPLSPPSPLVPNPSQHQGLFQWVSSSHQVAKVLEFQLQHQSFQWTPRTHLL